LSYSGKVSKMKTLDIDTEQLEKDILHKVLVHLSDVHRKEHNLNFKNAQMHIIDNLLDQMLEAAQ